MSVEDAIDALLMLEGEQRAWLERNAHPPLDASDAEALAFYGGPRAALSLWRVCRALERLRAARGEPGPVEPLTRAEDAPWA